MELLEDEDVDAIVNLMDSELGTASIKQDSSARSKFNSFLGKHIAKGLSMDTVKSEDVTKELIGKFLSFLFSSTSIKWQTSMNYLSSVKRQLEERTGTKLFQTETDWYRRCRRHLHRQYVLEATVQEKSSRIKLL